MSTLCNFLMENYSNYIFTEQEKEILRPIAETLALIDGNAFFHLKHEDNKEWYEMYLPDAMEIFKNNGGLNALAGQISWLRE